MYVLYVWNLDKKKKECILTHSCVICVESRKNGIDQLICKAGIETDTKNRCLDAKGWREVRWIWRLGLTYIHYWYHEWDRKDFPGGTVIKNPPADAGEAGNAGSTSGSGRSPGGGNGTLLHCSCLKNSKDRGACWAIVHGVTKRHTWLSDWAHAYNRSLMRTYCNFF